MAVPRDQRGLAVIEGKPKWPLYRRQAANVSAGDDRVIEVSVPDGRIFLINAIEVSPAAGTTIKRIDVDGHELGYVASVSALSELLGGPVWATRSVDVTVSAAQDDTTTFIVLRGLFVS